MLFLGWTQEAVAEAVGVSEAAIRRSSISLRFRGELPPEPTNREGKGKTGKTVKPLPADVAASLSDSSLARVAQLPEAA